tara:strand:- start:2845 stop:3330 length:486 start_codon:yes stop_codon:yes gene_type:complete
MESSDNYLIINMYSKEEFFRKVKSYLPDVLKQASNDINRSVVTIDSKRYFDIKKFSDDFNLYFENYQYELALLCITQTTIGESLIRSFPFLEDEKTLFSISSGNSSLKCNFDIFNDTCTINKRMTFFTIDNPSKEHIPFNIEVVIDLCKDIVNIIIDINSK